MAATDPELRTAVGRVVAATRWGFPSDVVAAKRELHETRLRVLIRRELAKAPALTTEQRHRLADALRQGDV